MSRQAAGARLYKRPDTGYFVIRDTGDDSNQQALKAADRLKRLSRGTLLKKADPSRGRVHPIR